MLWLTLQHRTASTEAPLPASNFVSAAAQKLADQCPAARAGVVFDTLVWTSRQHSHG